LSPFFAAKIECIPGFPLRTFNFDLHDNYADTGGMLQAQKEYQNIDSESEKKILQQKINLIDKQIDTLIYKLYELTDEEIKIIEEST